MSTCQDCPHFLARMDCSTAQKTLISSVQTLYLQYELKRKIDDYDSCILKLFMSQMTFFSFVCPVQCSLLLLPHCWWPSQQHWRSKRFQSNYHPLFALVPTFSPNSRRNKLATHARQTAESSFKFFFSRDIFIGFSNSVATNCQH